MVQPLSMDLRSRLLAAIDDGMSCRSAAARFGVAPSTAIRWLSQRRNTGSFAPKPQGGDMRSRRVRSGGRMSPGCSCRSCGSATWSYGQPIEPQARVGARPDRAGWRHAALPPALQPRRQSHRKGLLQTQGHAQKDRRADRERPAVPDRNPRRYLPAPRMRQLLHILRI